jgi:hemoglobin
MRKDLHSAAKSRFARIGGAPGIQQLVMSFYDFMQELPEAAKVRAMHDDLGNAQRKLELFLSEWFGGPHAYTETMGPPNLRMRHSEFAISPAERDAWLLCMSRALAQLNIDAGFRQELERDFASLAAGMTNTR